MLNMKINVMKFMKKHESGILKFFLIVIFFICWSSYLFSKKYVSGGYEIGWATTGVIYTNRNLMFLIAFAIAGGGSAWMIYKNAKRLRLATSILITIMIALIMTMHPFFFYIMPVVVILTFATLKLGIVGKIKNRRIKK